MVTDSFAFLCDARPLAVISTVITMCYLLIKLGTWLTDSFYAIPNETNRSQVTAMLDRDQDTQTTTKRNQSDTESQLTDSGHQTITAGNGLRVRTEQKGPETEYITKQSANTRGIQELAIFLPGQLMHDVLSPIEHHSRSEGLSTSAEHLG